MPLFSAIALTHAIPKRPAPPVTIITLSFNKTSIFL